jgi:hypothetical protein
MVQLEAMELALQISYGLTVRCHLWVNIVLVLHDLEMLDPELNSDPETVDQGFVLGSVV